MIAKAIRLLSRIKWHDFRSVEPISRAFGTDRGTPVDRHYIDGFLESNRRHVKGRALEIAESSYTKKYDSGVTAFEVLHFTADNPAATIVGDLTNAKATLPENRVDCFICTQTLNVIYDVRNAIKGIHQLLDAGGVALVTVPCISQISRYDADRWGDYWRFTPQSAYNLFAEVFGKENVEVQAYGNCLAAICFLKGLALEEMTKEELNHQDADFPLIIGIKAVKK